MKHFKNILVVSNPEGVSDALVARALWLAKANGARLTLLDVSETDQSDLARMLSTLSGQRGWQVGADLLAARKEQLEQVANGLRNDGAQVSTVLAQGVGFIEVIRHVLTQGNDLVLKAADQTPTWNVLGGPDLHLLRKCPCPVWILNSKAEPKAKHIVAAVDPDPSDTTRDALNNNIMQLATSLSVQDDAKLDVLNAWYLHEEHLLRSSRVHTPPEEIEALLLTTKQDSHARLTALTDQYTAFSDRMQIMHVKGIAADVIAQHAHEQHIDTLVMGTLGRTGLSGMFIGNTAETILSRVTCSVLAVKPEGFVSPVTIEELETH
ncbi:universal stress protein [Tateyamaria omphalii]|uniref:universal stress protein n=1 Tax=Tateyamaria omphalii TaxID=299262 RepID=UPI001C99B583|nr:universal stress protein [Tateyamaria omphalii]MBY5935587.1 universal stress protein [Tateyamaria omphalii]